MARGTKWDRFVNSYDAGVLNGTEHRVQLGTFDPGETITRIRFTYFTSSYEADNPILNDDVVIALGIDVSEDPSNPTLAMPATSEDADWMWWEGDTQGIVVYAEPTAGGILTEARGPMYRAPRDVKAQRTNTGTGPWSLWLKTQSTNGPGQGKHYLGYAVSVLILEAP
ncbi:MAG TPA: hypothetical protein ENO24_03155 [Chloroflexi bacterium]|nr:hypothetical protein [Chloroflexota bacterium]